MKRDQLIRSSARLALGLAVLGASITGAHLRGQDKDKDKPPDKPEVTVQVKVVNVPATVRDKHGKIVTNLTKEDFILQEDGRFQDIRYFSMENNLPLTLGPAD